MTSPQGSLIERRRTRIAGISFRHPAQAIVVGFAGAIFVATFVLMLPFASQAPGGTSFLTALFTATSAICVTGLAVVDTEHYWSSSGHVVLLLLIQLGGLGIMTLASMLTMVFSRRLRLHGRLATLAETGFMALGDLRPMLKAVVVLTLSVEGVIAAVLTLRYWVTYDESLGRATWLGLFHAVSAWNNAGFALYSDSLMSFSSDPLILIPVAAAVIAGGLGFPVILDVRANGRTYDRWSLHTKLTLATTSVLFVLGAVLIVWFEWTNPATLGDMPVGHKVLNGSFSSVMPRTAGFNSIDIANIEQPTSLVHMFLMFVGGGSASTAGGAKVTTVAVLILIVIAELKGRQDTTAFGRRISPDAQTSCSKRSQRSALSGCRQG
jgi:trk system potassium uptake protein